MCKAVEKALEAFGRASRHVVWPLEDKWQAQTDQMKLDRERWVPKERRGGEDKGKSEKGKKEGQIDIESGTPCGPQFCSVFRCFFNFSRMRSEGFSFNLEV